MIRQTARIGFILILSVLLFACAGEKKMELEMKVRLDDKPVEKAEILVDGVAIGTTDDKGDLSKIIKKKPGTEINVSVKKEMEGYRIEPWKVSFVMKLTSKDVIEKYSYTADLKAVKFFTISVKEKDAPVENAAIMVKGKKAGETDAAGEFVYEYKKLPGKGVKIVISKKGYSSWRKKAKVKPGERIEVSLSKRAVISVHALTDEYGQTRGIKGIVVRINGKEAGRTNAKGVYTKVYRGKPGRKVRLSFAVPGHIPSEWETSVVLKGRKTIKRYFYPAKPKPIRVGIYGYVSNTPDVDLTDILNRIGEAVSNNLFSYFSFKRIPETVLHEKIKKSKLNIEEITGKGWQRTGLIRTIDMIILGSVAKEDRGYTIETKVYTSRGKLILSQINTAKREKDVKNTAKDIVRNIIDRFPFEGSVVDLKDDRYKINLGKSDYRIRKGMEFALLTPVKEKTGKIKKFRDIGTLRVKKTKKAFSWAVVDEMQKDEKIGIGFKVVRRIYTEEERKAAQNTAILTVSGGLPPDVSPLQGVNIYLNDMWTGTTGLKGTAEIPVRLGKRYDIVLYRHGYQKVGETIIIGKDGEEREFVLNVNNSLFKVDSEPSKADISIDGEKIGRTPLLDGKLVNFGFHTLHLSVGGDYRDWEEVVEFNKKVEDRTGPDSIVFVKDFLQIGQGAEIRGDIDAAIQAYSAAGRDHPDYSATHRRLAQLYMDEKNDYDSAIREFENVLSLPENQQLIYKQFAVTYTNLGHAYYEKGNKLIEKDRDSAAQDFAKAVQNLQKAKQNSRFFPTTQYDEAVHDTYYYLALAHHKLYMVTKKNSVLNKADLAWREYFDFFPKKLEGDAIFAKSRESAEQYWTQIKDLL